MAVLLKASGIDGLPADGCVASTDAALLGLEECDGRTHAIALIVELFVVPAVPSASVQ